MDREIAATMVQKRIAEELATGTNDDDDTQVTSPETGHEIMSVTANLGVVVRVDVDKIVEADIARLLGGSRPKLWRT